MDRGQPLWGDLPVEERLARKFSMESSEKKYAPVTLPEVVVPRHEVQANFLPKQPREVWELLESKGRKVAGRHTRTKVEGTEVKSGKTKGQMRPDKFTDFYSIATMDKQLPVVYVIWQNADKVFHARVKLVDHSEVWPTGVMEIKAIIEEQHG